MTQTLRAEAIARLERLIVEAAGTRAALIAPLDPADDQISVTAYATAAANATAYLEGVITVLQSALATLRPSPVPT